MKTCPKCQAQLPDDAAYCTSCGEQLTYFSSIEPTNEETADSVRNVIRAFFTSPAALVAIIALSVSVALEFIAGINITSTTFISSFPSVTTVIIVIGLWVTYASAANKQQTEINISGLKVVRVGIIIEFVILCVGFGLLEIGLAILLALGESLSDVSGMFIGLDVLVDYLINYVLIAVMVLVAIIAPFMIVFYAKALKTLKTVVTSLTTGVPSDKVSTYAAVFLIILGIGSIPILGNNNVFSLLSNISEAVAFFAFAVCIFSYRKKMRELTNVH